MIIAKISSGNNNDRDFFTEMVDAVFLFMHEHYAEFGAILKESDINHTQYVALITIHMNVSLHEGELARLLFINPSTVSRMVYALEEKGWVKCIRDKADRRRVMVEMSPAGRRRMEAMRERRAEVVARQVALLAEEDRQNVYQAAERVNKALRLMTSTGAAEGGGAKE